MASDFDTYIGFYLGCILWAAVIKDLKKPVLNNLCFGAEYDEKETLGEVRFVREYLEQFKKDVKYYMGQEYKIDEFKTRILDEYEEFLKLNQGFSTLQNSSEIQLNDSAKALSDSDRDLILDTIAAVVESGNFKELYPLEEKLFQAKVSA